MSVALERLFRKYSRFECESPGIHSEDVARSLRYFREERSLIDEGRSLGSPRGRVSDWVRALRQIDAFIAAHDHLPRIRERLPSSRADLEENRLAEWLRYQRRPSVRVRLSTYQVERLECLPGFSWDPAGDRWDDQVFDYLTFIVEFGRKPRYRSDNRDERRLAGWAAKQRHLINKGTLSHSRRVDFELATNMDPAVTEKHPLFKSKNRHKNDVS